MRRAVLVVCLLTGTARANSDDLVARPISVPANAVAAELTVEINLAHNFWAEPLSFAPDLWWGATSRLTVGLVHSLASLDRFAPGGSICVRTDPLYCDERYHGSGLDARYRLGDGPLQVAPRVRAMIRELEPFKPAVTAGALAHWHRGRWGLTADPYLQLGLANQELGNRTQLVLPVEVALQPTCRWQLTLATGWNSALATFSDGWHVPLAFGVRARATTQLDIGATLGFASMLGPQNTPKQRVLFVAIGWRSSAW